MPSYWKLWRGWGSAGRVNQVTYKSSLQASSMIVCGCNISQPNINTSAANLHIQYIAYNLSPNNRHMDGKNNSRFGG
ncbi:hypothetical protein AG1IA_05402 [Rhizoctonia solani AG-1 IA]|uniref:Uncharacterized protein n=1 Tax=Thanatephorus cucumeris (strain AG1-IA) TaxID=983506 RepID=L8WUX0_THACA|nr:hypothetical protein AG1IA_05402 [Rhizoctonia solani AG-1 IA]